MKFYSENKEMMKKNMGKTDRIVRLILALLLFGYAAWKPSWIALAFGVFVLIEYFCSWCIIYQLIGKSSCPINRKK